MENICTYVDALIVREKERQLIFLKGSRMTLQGLADGKECSSLPSASLFIIGLW